MVSKEEFLLLYDDKITKKRYDDIIEKIDERFCEICKFFLKKKGGRFWFDYDTGTWNNEDSNGFFDPNEYKERIRIIGENFSFPIGYDDDDDDEKGIPTRWLWEENYKEEVKEKVKRSEEKEQREKEERRRRREDEEKRVKEENLSLLQAGIPINNKKKLREYLLSKVKVENSS